MYACPMHAVLSLLFLVTAIVVFLKLILPSSNSKKDCSLDEQRMRKAIDEGDYVLLRHVIDTIKPEEAPKLLDQFFWDGMSDDPVRQEMFEAYLRDATVPFSSVGKTVRRCIEMKRLPEFKSIVSHYNSALPDPGRFNNLVMNLVLEEGWEKGYNYVSCFLGKNSVSLELIKNCLNYLPSLEREFIIRNYFSNENEFYSMK